MIRFRTLLTLIFFVAVCIQAKAQTAVRADAGTGALKKFITWFNWQGVSIQNGASTIFTTSDGLFVIANISNVSPSTVVPSSMNTGTNSILPKLYDFTDPAVKPALISTSTSNTVTFQLSLIVSRDGIPAQFSFVAADAEASNNFEQTTVATTGTNWRSIEFFRNSSQSSNPVLNCGTKTVTLTDTYSGTPALGQTAIIATDATGMLTITTTMSRTSSTTMAIAFGIYSPVDRGDLPVDYTTSQHVISLATVNSCNYNSPFPVTSPANTLYLGNVPGDPDSSQSLDDNTIGVDEEAISVFPVYDGSGSYTLNIPVKNLLPTVATAHLRAWMDFNRDGVFGSGESVNAIVAPGSNLIPVTWTGLPPDLPTGSVSGHALRIRVASDIGDLASVASYGKDGEVEDYMIAFCNKKPDFSWVPNACDPRVLEFAHYGTDVTDIRWSFGDGQTNTGDLTPVQSYAAMGAYPVTMIVQNGAGCKDTINKVITLGGPQINSLILPNDTTICSGTPITIKPSSFGSVNCFTGPGSGGVHIFSDTTVTPTATSVYRYTVIKGGPNLLTNPDFTAGNTGFTSQYSFLGTNSGNGQYTIGSNPTAWNASYAGCRDHTNGSGNMLMADGSVQPGTKLWTQQINVTPNTNYIFSVWVQSLTPLNNGALRVTANSAPIIENLSFGGSSCFWVKGVVMWNSGENTSVELSISNNNTSYSANDFAIDDVYFGTARYEADSVKFTVITSPTLSVTSDTSVCSGNAVQLNAISNVSAISWSPATGLNASNIPDPLASPLTTTDYTVMVTASNNCKATKTVRVTVQPPPVFAVTPATQTICLGETMTVTASGGDSYNWTAATGITDPTSNKISFKPTASGSYSVAINHAACNRSQTLTATVQVNPLPVVTVSKSNDIDCSAIQAQLTATGGSSYVWTPAVSLSAQNIANPVTTTLVTTTYKVKVTSANGCYQEDSVTVYFNGGTQSNLMIPNAFTPNKDLLNDVFKVSFGGAKKFEMLVYNRWGELVFRSTDPAKGWDGNYRSKPQPQGVYIYLVTGEGICGGKVQRKGSVMLMR